MLRSRNDQVTGCTTDYSTSTDIFIGIPSEGEVAGGSGSGVLSGSDNEVCGSYDAIGGGQSNIIGGTNYYTASFIGAGGGNGISSLSSFIGAGGSNIASGDFTAIGAGAYNVVAGEYSFVGAGTNNQSSGGAAFIGGGEFNSNAGGDSIIGSGNTNRISAAATYASILGGYGNTASGEYSSIDGGNGNTASGEFSLVVGGNDSKATGAFGVVAGGADNQALGVTSFAAGYHAQANHNGSFVWSDEVSGSSPVADTNVDQFVVRATGGTFIYSSETLASGVKLASGSGTWASLSDRNAKTDLAPLDDASVLAKVAALPIGSWRYKTEAGAHHIGPMAQDFYAAFGVGDDDRHITSIDEDGVALVAIKGLDAKLDRVTVENGTLHGENRRLQSAVAKLAARNAELERRLDAIATRLHM